MRNARPKPTNSTKVFKMDGQTATRSIPDKYCPLATPR
jgi:hypothetical protein